MEYAALKSGACLLVCTFLVKSGSFALFSLLAFAFCIANLTTKRAHDRNSLHGQLDSRSGSFWRLNCRYAGRFIRSAIRWCSKLIRPT